MQSKRDGLIPIGDALSGLGGLVTTEPKTQPIAAIFGGLAGTVTVSLTKRRPSWWNRLRKQRFVDSIIKRMVSETVKELVDWARDFVPQLFQRERTASETHGSVHAA